MKPFECLQTTKNKKKKYYSNVYEIYKMTKTFSNANQKSLDYFKQLNIDDLQALNLKHKKYNPDLINLWAALEMEKLLLSIEGATINPYLSMHPIDSLDGYDFLTNEARLPNLLEIIFVKDLLLEQVEFKNLYIACYEVFDENNNLFRPYLELFVKNENNMLIKIGYGYDSNDNKSVEVFITNFNYPVFLNTNGSIVFPLTNKKIKIKVYDSLDQNEIGKLNNFKTLD